MSSAILASYTVCLVYWIVRVYFHDMLLLLVLYLLIKINTSEIHTECVYNNIPRMLACWLSCSYTHVLTLSLTIFLVM